MQPSLCCTLVLWQGSQTCHTLLCLVCACKNTTPLRLKPILDTLLPCTIPPCLLYRST
jgi:hypothetical protein